jgi:hypothetical protein
MAALLIAAVLLAGCASAGSQGSAAPPAAAAAAPLATSMTVAGGGTWAIVAIGGSAADENSFWELFTRPAGSTKWALDRRGPAEPGPDLLPAGYHQRQRQDLGHRAARRGGRRRP